MNKLSQDKLEQVEQLHNKAMDAAEQAVITGKQGNAQYRDLFRQAFTYERQAATLLADNVDFEPSRSVLHRSAAALALEYGEWRVAEQLICAALAGNPPEDIAEELRDLLQKTYVARIPVAAAA